MIIWKELKKYESHVGSLNFVSYSLYPKIKNVISRSYDGTWKIWDVERGNEHKKYQDHNYNDVNSVSYSPDGKNMG